MQLNDFHEAKCPVCGGSSLVARKDEPVYIDNIVNFCGGTLTCARGCGDFEVPIFFCENPACESEATETVPVSVSKPSDETRHYCYPCYEAYIVGVQHGKMIAGQQETTLARNL